MSKIFRKPKTIKSITNAQRAAAQANGALSKGPVTEEGKAKSALNAVTHGLSSRTVVLTTESRPEFEGLLQAYRDEYQPRGQTENDLVEELTAAKWLQRRCVSMQTALLDTTMGRMEVTAEFPVIDNAARATLAFQKQTESGNALALLNRYAASHTRDYHRALDKLRQIQKERCEHIRRNEPKREQPRLTDEHSRPVAAEHAPAFRQIAAAPNFTSINAFQKMPNKLIIGEPDKNAMGAVGAVQLHS